MRKFSGQSRDMAVAKSSSISRGFWWGALLAIVGLAGFVAKINPGKPIGSTNASSSTATSSLNGGYNATSPTLSPPPNSSSGPQQLLSPSSSPAPAPSPGPAISASGAS
ncbi:MAG: hypothetical protein HKL84_10230 [Acidimicrobiaceae bacterium]|nr:hypothetical protein [Acidimicrobiaceae bacterium]